ncbi:MAG: SDR family oxidoreductase [Acidimicrobiia bacterium]|nr:MAG: SDR family oxidoreductase [Acidimicrobiia bacterium]
MNAVDRNRDLAGKSILVTGGVGDIGRGIARVLLDRGASVTLLDRIPADEAQERVDDMGNADHVRYIEADVTDHADVDAAVNDMPDLDVAICNAGIVEAAPFLEITDDAWQRQIAVNLTGVFNTAQSAARRLVDERKPGLLLFTGSWVQAVPWPEIAAYSTTKAGVSMLAKSMARELAPQGVRVNVIAPGIVDAGLSAHQRDIDPQYAARIEKVIPMKRLGNTEEIGQLVAYLCSDEASYMTGSDVLFDGGCTLFQFD